MRTGDKHSTTTYVQEYKLANVLQILLYKKMLDPDWKALVAEPDPKNYADPPGPGSTTLDSSAQLLQKKKNCVPVSRLSLN